MSFDQAFDPFRAIPTSWRVLKRAPLTMLLGGIALILLTGGGEMGDTIEWREGQGIEFDWEDLPWLAFGALAGGAACIVGLLTFLGACFFGVTFPRAVERVVATGVEELNDLIRPEGRFLPMVVTQVLVGAIFVAGLFPLLLWIGTAIGVGAVLELQGLGGLGALFALVVWLPIWIWLYLGVRLAEPAVALEGLDPIAAIKRSWSIVRGNRLRLLVFLVILGIFKVLGVFLCCVGVLVTGTMGYIAVNESYLRLVRPTEEQAGWWLDRLPAGSEPPPGGGGHVSPDLSATLRRLLALIDDDAERRELAPDAAMRARDRLVRDLLPRTVSGTPYLVVGIVGPNNSGKSALFNALASAELSPSLATGGATRRLYGAASPELSERLRADPTLERFAVTDAGGMTEAELVAAAATTEDPGELLLFPVALPDGLLLIDTPDFDSVLEENRLASESLLAVADLAVAVVTRHTYQNREVVHFLERWLAHGRPWVLVYNEAPSSELAREHAAKLSEDLGHEPLAVFAAPHSIAVQEGSEPLSPASVVPLRGERELALESYLLDVEAVSEVKERALEASLAQLHDDLVEWSSAVVGEVDRTSALLAAAESHARVAAERVGACAMPGGPFIEAFRNVLDRRSNALTRSWRLGVRKLRLKLESLPSLFSSRKAGAGDRDGARESFADVERAELLRAWPALWEGLSRDLGTEGRVGARHEVADDLRAALDTDLAEGRQAPAREAACAALAASSMDLEAFQDVCEVLVEEGIRERGRDWDIQAAADVALLAPIAIATAVIIKTGGLGSDIGVAGGAALSSYLFDKYSHLLGTRITNEAARRWAEQRAGEVLPVLVSSVLGASGVRLAERRDADLLLAEEIRAIATEIRS